MPIDAGLAFPRARNRQRKERQRPITTQRFDICKALNRKRDNGQRTLCGNGKRRLRDALCSFDGLSQGPEQLRRIGLRMTGVCDQRLRCGGVCHVLDVCRHGSDLVFFVGYLGQTGHHSPAAQKDNRLLRVRPRTGWRPCSNHIPADLGAVAWDGEEFPQTPRSCSSRFLRCLPDVDENEARLWQNPLYGMF